MTAEGKLEFRSRETVHELARRLEAVVAAIDHKPVAVMHVCGSHEQAIA